MDTMIKLAGTLCVQLTTGLIGWYDNEGYCIVQMGSSYARPAEDFDRRDAPKDQWDRPLKVHE